jgi:hypothetical protein
MIFLVMFGSLAVAMAVASQGNVRAAQTHLHVVRAMGAAETGMAIAERVFNQAVTRFVVERGTVDAAFGRRIWSGTTTSGDGVVQVLPSANGLADGTTTRGVADAIVNAHLADLNIVNIAGFPSAASKFTPSGNVGTDFNATNWVRTALIGIDGSTAGANARTAAYQITYAPLANGTDVRIIVTGFSQIGSGGSGFHYGATAATASTARPVTRTIQQDFRYVKRPRHALVAPSRIMIGKNVLIDGNLGATYTDVNQNNGHPMTIRSDFLGLNPVLDQKLNALFTALRQFDVDGDNRLRLGHPTERLGVPNNNQDFNGDGQPDNAFTDVTLDGVLDEFDIFIRHFDTSGDRRVTLSASLAQGTPAEGQSAEFTLDDDLAILLDGAVQDRNRSGVSGWTDTNRNGRWDAGEVLRDFDTRNNSYPDRVLGWRDGWIDRRDQYAKVRGRLAFKVANSAWQAAQPTTFPQQLRGPIRPPTGESATRFGASADELPEVTSATFTNTQTPLKTIADGASFEQQVAQNLGIAAGQLATYTELGANSTSPQFWRADLDNAYVVARTGRPLWEKMPFNSPAFADYYVRPRYVNMTFKNVVIPRGNNGLFINCTFVGSTYIQTIAANTHPNWSLYGKLVWSESAGRPIAYTQPLDKSDFPRWTTGNVADGPANYNDFPDPPTIDAVVRTGAARDTKLYSNNIRFHDCLFVGSIVSDTPTGYTHIRNKMQFTGGTRFTMVHPDQPTNANLNPDPSDVPELTKSSMMLPNYSVDIGSFNSPTDTFAGGPRAQNVQLSGTVVAGLLDARGNTKIDGALMLTFAPVAGQGPLSQNGQAVGNPAAFNSTLGYFGPEDGDGESLDPERLPVVNGQRIVGWDLDGDGIADLNPDTPPTAAQTAAGAQPVPFYGYGRIELNWNPDLPMPDGILIPLSPLPLRMTYREGAL